jgi:predicted ATPase/class 3 adenylate cyclase
MLPTGTVTFVFSDIEGSTQRWETYRKTMDAAVKRHDAHLRAAMESRGGYVFKTVGDAFCVVFARVSDAVAACAHAQRALSAEDFSSVDGLRVRFALHTGEAVERNGDYFGPAVNRVARLMSIGHGGQVLVSGVTRDLARSDLPDGTTLVDLGSQRLRDLTEPERVWQLSIEGLPSEFPPLRSLDALPNNLPIAPTIFVGREHDVAEVKDLLGRHRLLTLVGSGGVGKTRLALQVGAELLDRYPDGVWFADLAPITDPMLVASVIAQALGMSQQEGRRVEESIPQWLKRKNLLLVLDNCEHVLETVASLVSSIVSSAPDVRILGASRQAIDLAGEVVHRLSSLSMPSDAEGLKVDEALRYDAIVLFFDRARAADTRFALTDDTAPIVAEICRRLDGIPLAIELAAARVKVLSIPNLAQRLNERFKILTGGSRDALPRQKTLSALIDWSYDLLTPQEQLLFTRLGVFAGGFSLDAATAVCGIEGLDEIEILDLLSSLTDKSLVVADTSGEQERYRLLESTAAYALEKLDASGLRETFDRAHAAYFRDRAEAAHEQFGTGSTLLWLANAELELDNYRTALEWALTHDRDAVMGGAIAGALGELWANAGLTVEGRYWMGRALERLTEAEQPRIVARMRLALSNLSAGKPKYDEAERAMRLYDSVGDARSTSRAQYQLAFALFQMGRHDDARDASAVALATARECGDDRNVASCLNQQAGIEWVRGDVGAARALYPQALSAFKKLGHESGMAMVLLNMAELEFADGHPEQALRYVTDALELDSGGKNASFIALVHNNSAVYRAALGDFIGARESAREGLRVARRAQAALELVVGLQHLALLAAVAGDVRRGAKLLGYVEVQYGQLGQKREPTEQWGFEKLTTVLHDKLSTDEISKDMAEGAAWSEDQAVEEAYLGSRPTIGTSLTSSPNKTG